LPARIFRFNPEKLKSLTTPVTVRLEKTWLESESESDSRSEGSGYGDASSWGDAYGKSEGDSASKSQAAAFYSGREEPVGAEILTDGAMSGKGSSSLSTSGRSEASSSFRTSNSSSTFGRSETLKPIIEKERQMQTYSIEEQTYEAAVRLKFQSPQHAIVRLPSGAVHEVQIPFVDTPYVNPSRIGRFREQTFTSMPCMRRVEEVKAEIEERRRALQQVKSDAVFTLTKEEQTIVETRLPPETIPISAFIQDDLE
jgi:hypothetical protein